MFRGVAPLLVAEAVQLLAAARKSANRIGKARGPPPSTGRGDEEKPPLIGFCLPGQEAAAVMTAALPTDGLVAETSVRFSFFFFFFFAAVALLAGFDLRLGVRQ